MSITPISLVRVSNNMQANTLLASLRQNTLGLFLDQNRLATGNRFNTLSEDPVTGARALSLTEILEQQNQIKKNIQFADSFLSATDTAVGEIHDLLSQAKTLASEAANTTFSQDQRDASAQLVLGLLNQLVTVGNRKLGDMYLFAGQRTATTPFTQFTGGVEYHGDTGSLNAQVDLGQNSAMNMSGAELFGSLVAQVSSFADLNPNLTTQTRLADLNGAAGTGVQKGFLRIATTSPATSFLVDLRSAETAGDVVDMINAAAAANGLTTGPGGQFNAAIHTNGGFSLTLAAGSVTVSDTAEGSTARDLGLLGTAAGTLNGADVNTRLTGDTLITGLFGGTGASLGSIGITNGINSATIDLSGATTVQDILNKINAAGLGVQAKINTAGTGIDVVNLTSGNKLSITEAGGHTAELLGIRSFYGGTLLSSLNGGRGVATAGAGKNDLHITSADGTAFDVALTGARTVQDVLDRINAAATAAGVQVTAALPANGNGIQLQDTSGGTGTLRIERADLSPAIDDLGLSNATLNGNTLVGTDAAARVADNMFSALLDLHQALIDGDTSAITAAGDRIDNFISSTARLHGVVGARSQAMNTRLQYTEAAVDSTTALLSDAKDLDYTEAITRFQQAQTTLQANLLSGSRMLQLSLMDFIST